MFKFWHHMMMFSMSWKHCCSLYYPLKLAALENSGKIPGVGIWAYFGPLAFVDKNYIYG